MNNKEICILGRGPSINFLPFHISADVEDFLLINDHRMTVKNDKILNIISNKDKKTYLMSNNNKSGFTPEVFLKLNNVENCVINRLYPDIEKWQKYKNSQKKNQDGGVLNNVKTLPPLPEDEPYKYSWRGPKTNKPKMFTFGDRLIKHMPDSSEKYLIPVAENNIICNCSYYASLYSILELNANKITYFGIDFYNHIKIDKKWFIKSPSYLSSEWWKLRLAYEGEHMKILWEKYLTKFFPNVVFQIYTTDKKIKSNKKNLKVVSL